MPPHWHGDCAEIWNELCASFHDRLVTRLHDIVCLPCLSHFRYFQCPPRCGLFAPLTKVEKVGRPVPTARVDPRRLSLTRSHATEETASITSAGSAARRAGVPLRYTESASPVGSMTSSMSVPLSPANSQIGQVSLECLRLR